MYKHLCSWLLYGYVYDPYHEFFIQPSKGESHDHTSQSQEEDDDLGIMGVTGRQLQVRHGWSNGLLLVIIYVGSELDELED